MSGMSFSAIGEKYQIDPRTAKRYALNNLPLEHLENRPFTSVLDPYKNLIDSWLVNGRIFASLIHDRLTELGCSCSYTTVNDYVRKKINEYEMTGIYPSHMHTKKSGMPLNCRSSIEKRRMKGI